MPTILQCRGRKRLSFAWLGVPVGKRWIDVGHDRLKALRLVIASSGLALGAGLAAPSDESQTALATLARTGEVSCEPALPVFCGNIHVSCSGPSPLKAFPFKLRAIGSRGWIEPTADTADTAGVGELYENGRLDWDAQWAYVIVWPHRTNGYVKVLADGSYSFRHYSQDGATMSRGHCR